jgi:peptidyl-prolyl cis-trans isomerase SurA
MGLGLVVSRMTVQVMKRCRRALVAFAAAAILTLPFVKPAEATIVERVVAVVGERPILLTDLRHRARPFLARIYATGQTPAQIAANETQMFKELLNRMIDDRLEEQAADRARLSVTLDEVDNAIRNIAAQAKIDPKTLIAEAKRQGLTEQDYRDELRRQVLEGKLVQLRVRGRVKVTDEDGKAAYARWLKESGAQVDVRILALRSSPTPAIQQARALLADDLVKRARAGEDFCKLVTQYSDDTQTNQTCGSRGMLSMENLVKEVQAAIAPLKEGETTDPIHYAPNGAEEATLIVQLYKAAKIPTFAEVRDQMMDRAFGDAMERQRKVWLADLRRGVYVDVRL